MLSPAEREPAGVGLVDIDDQSRSAEPARRRGRVPRLLRRLPKITMCRFCEGTVLVGPGVFLPRAESERLAVEGLAVLDDASRRVVDVGCGSGAVAVTLAAGRPHATVLATDVSAAALWWTLVNGWRRGRRMRVAKGTVLAPLPASWRGEVDLVVANVPFLRPQEFDGASDVGAFGYVGEDPDGLGLHRLLVPDAAAALRHHGWLLVQATEDRMPALSDLLDPREWDMASHVASGSAAIFRARRVRAPEPTERPGTTVSVLPEPGGTERVTPSRCAPGGPPAPGVPPAWVRDAGPTRARW